MASWDGAQAAERPGEDGLEVGSARWHAPARWLQPGRVAWASFLVIWGGLSLVGAPIDLAMIPAAACAVVNLILLRSDERQRRLHVPDHVPDHVPAAWSGIGAGSGEEPTARDRRGGPDGGNSTPDSRGREGDSGDGDDR